MKVLNDFPLETVRNTSTFYNKAFHAKLFTLFASSESEVFAFAQQHSPHYEFCFAFMENDEGQWYLDISGIKRLREWVVEQAKKENDAVFALYEMWENEWRLYLRLCKEINETKLQTLDDAEVYTLFERFYKHYLLVGSVAYIADSFMSTGTEDWLEQLILKEIKTGEKVTAVRTLTSPVHLSFSLEAEYELLKIAALMKHKHKDVEQLLKLHEERYHWLQNNYYNVHHISAEEFKRQIEYLLKESEREGIPVEELLREKENELKNIRKQREELITTLGLTQFTKNILDSARLFSRWKDIRKSGVYRGMYYFDLFLEEIAKRKEYTKKELTFVVFEEIKDLFIGNKEMHDEIKKRQERCFFAVTPKGYFIASGKDADRYFEYGKKDVLNVAEIRGVVACQGYARGRVRIIRKTEEMNDFRQGEILVTNQTTPEFVPIMKKAAAIVTEQGGITSHAAVVSRELKKPCIIGTKIATSALINGETVEVDANNGIVRRER